MNGQRKNSIKIQRGTLSFWILKNKMEEEIDGAGKRDDAQFQF
jgi:hypothetical protein